MFTKLASKDLLLYFGNKKEEIKIKNKVTVIMINVKLDIEFNSIRTNKSFKSNIFLNSCFFLRFL
jgi:hypothetical protein